MKNKLEIRDNKSEIKNVKSEIESASRLKFKN